MFNKKSAKKKGYLGRESNILSMNIFQPSELAKSYKLAQIQLSK